MTKMSSFRSFASPDYKAVATFRDQEQKRVWVLNNKGAHMEIMFMSIQPALLGKIRFDNGWMNYMEIPMNGEVPEIAFQKFKQDVEQLFPAKVESQHQGYVLHMLVE